MHDIVFMPISDIFHLILADTDTDIFPIVWKQHHYKQIIFNFGYFLTITYLLALHKQ